MASTPVRFIAFDATDPEDPALSASKKEINESPESSKKCLESLRNSLKTLEGIDPCLDDDFLLRFLRVSKFDVPKALQRLKKYHQQSDTMLDAFKKCSASLHNLKNLNHIWLSPYRMEDNSALVVFLNREVDYRKYTFAERFYLELICLNAFLANPLNQICGISLLADLEGFGFPSLCACTPGWVKIFLDLMLNTFPVRARAIHVVNTPFLFYSVYKIVYPFLSKKIQDRILFHPKKDDEWKSLHQSIPVDILPEQYNGKIKNEDLINGLSNREDLDEKFRNLLVFGCSKTKQRRLSVLKKLARPS